MNLKKIVSEIAYAIISTKEDCNTAKGTDLYFFIPSERDTMFSDEFNDLCIEKIRPGSPLGEGWLFDVKGIEIIKNMFHQQGVIYMELTISNARITMPI